MSIYVHNCLQLPMSVYDCLWMSQGFVCCLFFACNNLATTRLGMPRDLIHWTHMLGQQTMMTSHAILIQSEMRVLIMVHLVVCLMWKHAHPCQPTNWPVRSDCEVDMVASVRHPMPRRHLVLLHKIGPSGTVACLVRRSQWCCIVQGPRETQCATAVLGGGNYLAATTVLA